VTATWEYATANDVDFDCVWWVAVTPGGVCGTRSWYTSYQTVSCM
jgi:hypothetical protein